MWVQVIENREKPECRDGSEVQEVPEHFSCAGSTGQSRALCGSDSSGSAEDFPSLYLKSSEPCLVNLGFSPNTELTLQSGALWPGLGD